MKALSVKQPWAHLMATDQKTIAVRMVPKNSTFYPTALTLVGEVITLYAPEILRTNTITETWTPDDILLPGELQDELAARPPYSGCRASLWEKLPRNRVVGYGRLVEVKRYKKPAEFLADAKLHRITWMDHETWNYIRSNGRWVFGLRFDNLRVWESRLLGLGENGVAGFWPLPDDIKSGVDNHLNRYPINRAQSAEYLG